MRINRFNSAHPSNIEPEQSGPNTAETSENYLPRTVRDDLKHHTQGDLSPHPQEALFLCGLNLRAVSVPASHGVATARAIEWTPLRGT